MRLISVFGVMLAAGVAGAVPLELDYIYPAGCRRGDSCTVTVGGNWAGNSVSLGCSGAGVKTEYSGAVYIYLTKTGARASVQAKARVHRPNTRARLFPGTLFSI